MKNLTQIPSVFSTKLIDEEQKVESKYISCEGSRIENVSVDIVSSSFKGDEHK